MSIDLTDPIFTDERKAREHLEAARWPSGPTCPHCGNADRSRIYAIKANADKKIREGLYECAECRGSFTVRTGSVMESSHAPLTKWSSYDGRQERHERAPATPHDWRDVQDGMVHGDAYS